MRRAVWPAIAAAIFSLTAALDHGGAFVRLDNGFAEWRARLLAHEVESDIVVIGIDAASLRALNEWPWPRRHHARLLLMLGRSEPAAVFLDIDFSATSSPEDDALLARELGRWQRSPLLLATHFQYGESGQGDQLHARPLPELARHAEEASVILRPDADGLVRRLQSSWRFGDADVPSAFSHGLELGSEIEVPIDFSILPSSFSYASFIDVIGARIDPATFDGKRVLVGAVAAELQDTMPVPVHRSLPGVVVQALAHESARAGIVRSPDRLSTLAGLALLVTACAASFGSRGWRRNLVGTAAVLGALAAAHVTLYAVLRIDVPVVVFAAAAVLLFIAATVRSLDRETWRALAYSVGLARKDALLRSIVDSSIDSIVTVDGTGTVRTVNPAAAKLFGREARACVGVGVDRLLPDLLLDGPLAALAGRIVECVGRGGDGDEFPVEVAISRVDVDNDELYTAIVRDISERKEHEAKLEHQAMHDSLTGLPNRAALTRHLNALLPAAGRPERVCVLMLDLCRFKDVNDTLGHDIGDEVLVEAAARFREALDWNVLVCRLGGDEFTVVMSRDTDGRRVDAAVAALVESLKVPINVRGIAIEVGVSIGVARAPDHTGDGKELLQRADVAMYLAKQRGSTVEHYDPAHDRHTVRRLAMVSALRRALETGGVEMFYQPQVDLATGCVRGVEALMRWEDEALGRVSPGEFVPLAETTDLIGPLTDFALSRALEDLALWQRRGLSLRVAVNLSARVVQDADLPRRVRRLLTEHGVVPDRLEIEITESAMLVDPERALRVVSALKRIGVAISIDDYGTGFSSLGYLRDLQADVLKLDKSFVTDLENQVHNRVIVESTAKMAHALGLEVVAEGVETEWVAAFLASAGFDIGQGWLYSQPLTREACYEFVVRRDADARRDTG